MTPARQEARETAIATALAFAFIYESRSFPPEVTLEQHRRTAEYFHSVGGDVGDAFEDLFNKFMARNNSTR